MTKKARSLETTCCEDCPMCNGKFPVYLCLCLKSKGARLIRGLITETPEWCPLRKGPVTITLSIKEKDRE